MVGFGYKLRYLRREKKFTLRKLAEESGLSYSFIGALERGTFKPSRESIKLLAAALDAPENDLLILGGFVPDESLNGGGQTLSETKDKLTEAQVNFIAEEAASSYSTSVEQQIQGFDPAKIIEAFDKKIDRHFTEEEKIKIRTLILDTLWEIKEENDKK